MGRIVSVLYLIILLFSINGSCNSVKTTALKDNPSRDSIHFVDQSIVNESNIIYYVSNEGDDNNSGLSPENAWQTIAKVNGTRLNPGTFVFFRRGDEWRETLIVDECGASGSPISFEAYGKGRKPIINGANPVSGWIKTGPKNWEADCPMVFCHFGLPNDFVVVAYGKMYKRVSKLEELDSEGEFFIGTRAGRRRVSVCSEIDPNIIKPEVSARMFGVCVAGQAYISIKNLDFRNGAHSGAFFMARTETKQLDGHCVIDSCNFFRNRISGIIFDNGYSSNIVKNCTSTFNGNGFYCSSDQNWGSDRNVFSHCYSSDNINHLIGVYSDGHGFGIWNSDDNIVEHCESNNDKYGIVIDPNSRDNDIIIRYNHIHNTQEKSPGINVGGNTPSGTFHQVYYNLIANTGAGEDGYAIWVYGRARQGEVHINNNTIYQDGDSSHSAFGILASAGNNLTVKNNIVYSEGRFPFAVLYIGSELSGSSVSNNVYCTPNSSKEIFYYAGIIKAGIEEWKGLTGQESGSRKTDPAFIATGFNFSLKDNSPCINAGVNLGYTVDIYGNPITGLPDIGCIEKQ
jgi:hypothetical protein